MFVFIIYLCKDNLALKSHVFALVLKNDATTNMFGLVRLHWWQSI